ncbi:MAG: ATP-binding cassette domain-containing protein, partial [Burkholderiaceae bacterium]|nr:ATP-binding cassette domain-containing protein [Burkholderiaceae bacterium]
MTTAAPEPVIQFEDVCLSFGGECVLDGIAFEVRRGDTLVIQGAAASGKTLILKLSLGLLRPTRGRIRLFGEDVTDYTDSQWNNVRARIGVLFQEGGLFDSLTVEENVA